MIGVSLNPTKLTVGKTGMLGEHRATVVGRAVLQSAERDRWYEYYVELQGGRMIILAYEGGVWKRFDELTPEKPFTVREAATCRVGDNVELGDTSAHVKYVSTSRVVYSEGKTWDGVRAGSEARYFNAQSEDAMLVVSWTGDAIEFYTGTRLASFVVPHAFKLPEPSFWQQLICDTNNGLVAWMNPFSVVVVLAVIGVAYVIFSGPSDSSPVVNPPPIAAAPSIQLRDGAQGTLSGDHFVIRRHALVEIDELGRRFQSYEYNLTDDNGGQALLVENLDDTPSSWVLLRTVPAPNWLTPTAAAAVREGATLRLGAREMKVQRLLLTRTVGGVGPAIGASAPGTLRYGFLAQLGDTSLLARWDEQTLDLEQGQTVPESAIHRAFGSATGW